MMIEKQIELPIEIEGLSKVVTSGVKVQANWEIRRFKEGFAKDQSGIYTEVEKQSKVSPSEPQVIKEVEMQKDKDIEEKMQKLKNLSNLFEQGLKRSNQKRSQESMGTNEYITSNYTINNDSDSDEDLVENEEDEIIDFDDASDIIEGISDEGKINVEDDTEYVKKDLDNLSLDDQLELGIITEDEYNEKLVEEMLRQSEQISSNESKEEEAQSVEDSVLDNSSNIVEEMLELAEKPISIEVSNKDKENGVVPNEITKTTIEQEKDKVKREVEVSNKEIEKKESTDSKKNEEFNQDADINKGVVFEEGMSLRVFLKANKNIRLESEVLKWFTKQQIQEALSRDEVLIKKGKFILW